MFPKSASTANLAPLAIVVSPFCVAIATENTGRHGCKALRYGLVPQADSAHGGDVFRSDIRSPSQHEVEHRHRHAKATNEKTGTWHN
jgi:hypothetical protein